MIFRRAVLVAGALLFTTGVCSAQGLDLGGPDAAPRRPLTLSPRQPTPKTPSEQLAMPLESTGRLIVKFNDHVQARASAQGLVASVSGVELTTFQDILEQYGLTCWQAIGKPIEELQALQDRAADYSGKAQPDLAGMMYVSGPQDALLDAARAINDLTTVEWVEIEQVNRPSQEDPVCGDAGTGNCFGDPDEPPNETPLCDNEACCEFIGAIWDDCIRTEDPVGEWDFYCADLANLYCEISDGADRCRTPLNNGDCREVHGTAGCWDEDCCNAVGLLDPFCTSQEWDSICVQIAIEVCVFGEEDDPTPNFSGLQGYYTLTPYLDPLPAPYDNSLPPPVFADFSPSGFDGEGWWLEAEGDDPGPYDGFWGLGEELLLVYGVDATGEGNLTRGRTIKAAVIEWAYWVGHEDLDVISEPGQTLLIREDITAPSHATACLGIIGATDNGAPGPDVDEVGMIGIAPECELYFFPLTSRQQGPRFTAAWVGAITTLGPGDVISCSFGPGGAANLNTSQFSWTFIRLASDLGITVCVAAGNACANLDDATDLGDSGGIVVGAGAPGTGHYRLAFSNYYTQEDPFFLRSNIVHTHAWGTYVASCGYGDIWFPGGDKTRSYTAYFGGTSAACPQIAGLCARLQGLAKQFYGIPLQPEQIRAAVSGGIIQGWGSRFFPGGFPDDLDCALDFDIDEGPNWIGPYPYVVGDFSSSASYILNQSGGGFDEAPLTDDVVIVRGRHVWGNKFSIKANDGLYLVVEAENTKRASSPSGPVSGVGQGPGNPGDVIPQINELTYLAQGDITDVVVVGHSDLPVVNSMTIQNDLAYPGVFTLLFVEAYNWRAQRWSYVDFAMLDAPAVEGGDLYFEHVASAARRFVNSDTDQILVRLWTLGFTWGIGNQNPIGEGGGGLDTYRNRIDLVNIVISEEFGEQLP